MPRRRPALVRVCVQMNALLMKAEGVHNPNGAVSMLLGRPRVAEEREETVKIHTRVPRS
ncbi:MAG: hypothetical protein ABF758_09365 [Bifidobacterium sp.]|uniref:hypothetical protein n=1 Tax=Bifidobacterium sp. TaxID=41200 RepID=UPI0039EA87C1